MLTPEDCSLAQVREGKTEVSSSIPVNATHEQQGQHGGASQQDMYRREREGASFKSFNNLPPISKVKNQALREQIQSYHELQWSGHALKITLITYRKEDIQMLMSDMRDEQIIHGQTLYCLQ